MKWVPGGPDRRARSQLAIVLAVALVASLIVIVPAFAIHGNAALGGNFEIDDDANLKNDDGAPFEDWADLAHPNGPEIRATDAPTGQNDDSYKGGVKEDTDCPAETTGSIPNNKSDLLTFHVYEEEGTGGHPGFLNVAWSRVSDPSGTTLMDFEFNQEDSESAPCPQGPNVQRTDGDLLVEYAIDQGGAQAEITGRFWDDANGEWGDPISLDTGTGCGDGPCAVGTINSSVIPAGESDGLGEKQERTFGEAQIDLRLLFGEGPATECTSFGSAMLKSRSSDSFTSQLKDFIRPRDIDINNCATVIIRKQTDPDGAVGNFDFAKNFATDPASPNTFMLADGEAQDYGATVLFGTGLTVTETDLPAGFELSDISCSNTNVTALFSDSSDAGDTPEATFEAGDDTVTFDLNDDGDVLDCTFTNQLQVGAIKVTKTRKHAALGSGDHPHAGINFTITGGDLAAEGTVVTTDADGEACLDGLAFADDYAVTETTPTGYADNTAQTGISVSAVSECGDGNEVGVSFSNTPLTNVTVSVDSQVDGGTASTMTCTDSEGNVFNGSTGANGDGSLTVNDLLPTDPTVTLTCTIVIDP